MPTQKQIKRLIRRANKVLVNDIICDVASFMLQRGRTGPCLKVRDGREDDPKARIYSFTMQELTSASVVKDNETLVLPETRTRLGFVQFVRIRINEEDSH